MKRRTGDMPNLVGSGSLLTILAVLCLTALTVLSLSSVRAEQRLAEASAEAARAYYDADCRAEAIFARLRSGEQVPGVEQSGENYQYQCVISDNQTLEVTLQKTAEGWQVLRWQAVAQPLELEETRTVWDGKEGTP